MQVVLFDNAKSEKLFPLTATRAVGMLRMGIYSCKERWEIITGEEVFIHSRTALQVLYKERSIEDAFWIDASVLPDNNFINEVFSLKLNEALIDENQSIIACRTSENLDSFRVSELSFIHTVKVLKDIIVIEYPWHIMQLNHIAINMDIDLIKSRGKSIFQNIPDSVTAINPENIFIEEGADVQYCCLNASNGPIYIVRKAVIQEGAFIRGPFVLGENSMVKIGAKIFGATSIGNNCVIGGEIKNIVMLGNSNKAHDGYLGDSVIGEWCNFGAGTSNSNIKNTGGTVKVWNDDMNDYLPVGQKCGLIMGDYCKTAINSSINTGSVFGICCNVFGNGLLPKRIKNFSWGAEGIHIYDFDKALLEIENWKKMKQNKLSSCEITILRHIFDAL